MKSQKMISVMKPNQMRILNLIQTIISLIKFKIWQMFIKNHAAKKFWRKQQRNYQIVLSNYLYMKVIQGCFKIGLPCYFLQLVLLRWLECLLSFIMKSERSVQPINNWLTSKKTKKWEMIILKLIFMKQNIPWKINLGEKIKLKKMLFH